MSEVVFQRPGERDVERLKHTIAMSSKREHIEISDVKDGDRLIQI